MKNKFMRFFILPISAIILVVNLSGCLFIFPELFSKKTEEAFESYTDNDGRIYHIVNKNHFNFDDYNILEVIVSDTERFVLYDFGDESKESGTGEWIGEQTWKNITLKIMSGS